MFYTSDCVSVSTPSLSTAAGVAFLGAFFGVVLGVDSLCFGKRTVCILGSTPPCAIVTLSNNLLSSSSLRIASCICRGFIVFFFLSLAALPESSKSSALKYSKTAAR